MTFDKTVTEVKNKLETVGGQAQNVAKVSLKTLKAANEIVIDGVQTLVATQTGAAKELFTTSKKSFDKAVAAGLVAVAKSPVEYLPDGRETIVTAFNESVQVVTKTGEKLVKVAKAGYEGVSKTIAGKQPTKARKKAVRKMAATAGATQVSA